MGKNCCAAAFGEQGPSLDVDFAQMEEVARAAAPGLTAGALEDAPSPPGQPTGKNPPRPPGGRLCPVSSEERPFRVKGGVIQPREPKCHCPTCRRDFFPS